MIVDSSAILAILFGESDQEIYESKLEVARQVWISPINWWEVMVRARTIKGEDGERVALDLMDTHQIEVALIGAEAANAAFVAFRQYKGRPARLNMGDCFAYALAKQKDLPLLFKGNDFAATDVKVA